jgi:hypothetical protein
MFECWKNVVLKSEIVLEETNFNMVDYLNDLYKFDHQIMDMNNQETKLSY